MDDSEDFRILTEDETAARRAQTARGGPDRSITMCVSPGCVRPALNSPWCPAHRTPGSRVLVRPDLSDEDIARITAEVEAKAAPLFVLAMDWIARQEMGRFGIALPAPIVTREGEGDAAATD
jgi:hypothetical protein